MLRASCEITWKIKVKLCGIFHQFFCRSIADDYFKMFTPCQQPLPTNKAPLSLREVAFACFPWGEATGLFVEYCKKKRSQISVQYCKKVAEENGRSSDRMASRAATPWCEGATFERYIAERTDSVI